MNRVDLIGRMTRDPETRQGKETTVTRFSLAVDRKGKDNGTDFIPCVAFGKTAETIEKYFKKGDGIALTGHIQTGSYTNKDNQKVYTVEVILDGFEFLPTKKNEPASSSASETEEDGDVAPFV